MEHQDLVDKNEESIQSIEKVSNAEDQDKMNEVESVKSELVNVDESKDLQSETCCLWIANEVVAALPSLAPSKVMDIFIKAAEYMKIPVRRTDDEPLQKLFMLLRSELNLDLKNIKVPYTNNALCSDSQGPLCSEFLFFFCPNSEDR
ncbi:hypothetical protein HN51_004538 [Arachis hypogaea]